MQSYFTLRRRRKDSQCNSFLRCSEIKKHFLARLLQFSDKDGRKVFGKADGTNSEMPRIVFCLKQSQKYHFLKIKTTTFYWILVQFSEKDCCATFFLQRQRCKFPVVGFQPRGRKDFSSPDGWRLKRKANEIVGPLS